MKPIYTISCINETESIDDLCFMSNIYLSNYHTDTIPHKALSHQINIFINDMQNNLYLLLHREETLINNTQEKNVIGYAVINNNINGYLIHAISLTPRRRWQWGWTRFLQHIINTYNDKRLYFPIHSQSEYDEYCKSYESLNKSRIPSIQREKLLSFASNHWFTLHNTHHWLYTIRLPLLDQNSL